MFHPIRSNNSPSKRNNLHHPRDIVVLPSLHVRYAGNLKRRPVVWSSPLPSLPPSNPRFRTSHGIPLRFRERDSTRRAHDVPPPTTFPAGRGSRGIFIEHLSLERGRRENTGGRKKKEEVKEQETRGGKGKKHAMSSSAKRREGIATSISHQEPTLLSLFHSFPLDKEASMNWSGVLDNLIKGRLPSLATAGPSHPLCDSLAPFCHP